MRIAFLTPEFTTEPYFDGGLANYLNRVTRALADRGHDVEIFVISNSVGSFMHGPVLVHRVSLTRDFLRFVLGGLHRLRLFPLANVKSMLVTAHALAAAFHRRSAQVHFDIVQAASFRATGLFVAKRQLVPIVTRVSSYAPWMTEAGGHPLTVDQRLGDWLELVSLRRSDACYAPSQLLAEALTTGEAIPTVVIEPPFIPFDQSFDYSVVDQMGSMPRYLLNYGSICRLKGAGVLAEALPPLLEQIPDLSIVLVGKCTDVAGRQLVSLNERYPNQIRYLGVLPAAQLQPLVQKSVGVVLPSLIDNLPNTCIESIYAGRVVIGTRGASFEQLIDDGRSGLLVPPGDAAALQLAMARVWHMDDTERTQMGSAAKERIARLHPDVTIPGLESFYAAVIAGKKRVGFKSAIVHLSVALSQPGAVTYDDLGMI